MKVCIFGSREIDKSFCDIEAIMGNYPYKPSEIVSGKAIGADLIGEWWAEGHMIPVKTFPADWKRFGLAAGEIRNREMHDYCDAGLALWDHYSNGTANMIKLFHESNKPLVTEIFDIPKIFRCKVCFGEADIFCFGSNESGKHGKGSALHAKLRHKAAYGKGFGIQGNSFAIPTKSSDLKVLSIDKIRRYVEIFIEYAEKNKNKKFYITNIGTGLAGYPVEDIAPLFLKAPPNCMFSGEWSLFLGRTIL